MKYSFGQNNPSIKPHLTHPKILCTKSKENERKESFKKNTTQPKDKK